MLSSLTETITGCPTIRAFGCGQLRVQRFQQLVDDSMANMHASNCLNRQDSPLGSLCIIAPLHAHIYIDRHILKLVSMLLVWSLSE